jgi:hypothetical protein
MNHWILMFRPETYEKVKEHGLIGVNSNQYKRIEAIASGDKFVAYVSRLGLLDGRGTFTSSAFLDVTPVFGKTEIYPYRARVHFELTGAKKEGREMLWGISEFANGGLKTSPANMLFCRGGFMKITAEDYAFLSRVLDGTWTPPEVKA